jgi:hypothetical protein
MASGNTNFQILNEVFGIILYIGRKEDVASVKMASRDAADFARFLYWPLNLCGANGKKIPSGYTLANVRDSRIFSLLVH